MKDDVKSALEFVRKWQENDPDGKHIALGAAVTLRDHILSTVAEPTMKTFNAEWAKAFVEKCRLVYVITKHDPKLVYSDEPLVAELLAAMGGRGGDEGWRPIETAPKDGSVFLASLSNGEVVQLWATESIRKPLWQFNCAWWGTQTVSRSVPYEPSHRELSGSLLATHWRPLPAAPGERSGK